MTSLNDYEAAQVRAIANWKSERPSFLLESFRAFSRPFSKLLALVVPRDLAKKALVEIENLSLEHDSVSDLLKSAGVSEISELRGRPLEECDRLARQVSVQSEHLALLEGAVPAIGGLALPVVGGVVTSVVDVPFLLQASLRAIRRIGHCYGFPLDTESDSRFVLAILDIANKDDESGFEEIRHGLWDPNGPDDRANEGAAVVDGIEQAVSDDLPLESVPFLGDLANLVLDHAFVRRADITARRIFQERWLRENEKVESIPAVPESHRRSSIEGIANVASELVYVSAYGVAFGTTFTAVLAGSAAVSIAPESVRRGFRDGASAAAHDSTEFLKGLGRAAESPANSVPSLVHARA